MKQYFSFLLLVSFTAGAQTLTVEKIMRDPKWLGTSPSNNSWSYDSKQVLFNWNPDNATSDSTYSYQLNKTGINKLAYKDARLAAAISNGTYNRARKQVVFTLNGDIFLLDVVTGNSKRITQTTEAEYNVRFIIRDSWIAYQSGSNLFAWNIATGITRQLTDFQKEKTVIKTPDAQALFLQSQQLNTSDVLKQRKEKREQRLKYLDQTKDADTLAIIYTGDKLVRNLDISPDGRFVTYNLLTEEKNTKRTDVPNYVTESGYTTNIPGRTNVGSPRDNTAFYLFDQERDTAMLIKMDSLPGIKDKPAYFKDYAPKASDTATYKRTVNVRSVFWNLSGSAAILDIRSQDFKDRWLMLLNTTTGKLSVADRQHDDAWIAGPGIGGRGTAGWIDDQQFYYQSEATGYAHLYVYNTNTNKIQQLTKGKYEVQDVTLSNDRKYFYLLTNEAHPGKQNFYRIHSDGSNKVQLTSMTGGYEVQLSPDEKYIAYRYSEQTKPWELYLQENQAGKKPIAVTNKGASEEFKTYTWRDTKIFSFMNRDSLPVYARIYEPAAGKKNNAAVIFVHGAGYLQNVSFSWSYYFREMMFNNLLADKGYTVLDIDYRASAGYGRDWRTAIYRYMGGRDLDDEVDAAKLLAKEYGIDPNRIGMYGGSYGGFMTLMGLFTQPNVFKAGAALRPVTDWSHYNDGYTGSILNDPATDSIAYQRSSPINFASGLQQHLLILHGMVDVNVHYQDAVRLSQRLIELGKDNWEMAAYPVEDHGFVEPSSWTDEYKRILKLFDTQLLKP